MWMCWHPKKKESLNKQIFRVALLDEPASLDPRYGFDAKTQLITRALFEGLMRTGPEGNIYPALAENITISEDKMTYTFYLRDCVWSNKEPILASDFAYAWKCILSSHGDSTLCDLFYPIKNAKAIKEKRLPVDSLGIKVQSPKVLTIELEHPAPYFLRILSNPIFSPICEKADKENSAWSKEKGSRFICNGPFQLKEWEHNRSLTIEKNPYYHDAKSVTLSEIQFSIVDNANTILLMFEKGLVDWAGDPLSRLPLEALPSFIEKNQLHIHPTAGVLWLECNTEAFPLNSIKIRKALAYAVDRKIITDNILLGQHSLFSTVPEQYSQLDKADQQQDLDLELAQQLFREGLIELGISESEFPPLHFSYPSHPGYKTVAEAIQQQWKENLNIDVELGVSEWKSHLQNLMKHQFEIAAIIWVAYFEDPLYHLQVFRSKENSSNFPSWENKEYQRLLDLIEKEADETTRNGYLRKAEKILLEEMPVIPICNSAYKYVKPQKVQNSVVTALGGFEFKWISIQEDPLTRGSPSVTPG